MHPIGPVIYDIRETLCFLRTEIRALPNPSPPVRIGGDEEEAEVEVADDCQEELDRPPV